MSSGLSPQNHPNADPYSRHQLNLRNLFLNAEGNFGPKEIVYADRGRYTYSRFFGRVRALAAGLSSIGVGRGDVVAVLDWDTSRYMEAYFAIPMMGAVLHTVNIRYPPELIFLTMEHAGDRYVIVRDEFLPALERSASMFDLVKGWIVNGDAAPARPTALRPSYDYEELVARGSSGDYEFPDVDEDSTATIFYTSGTTGMPKGVTFTHRDLVMHTLALASMMSMKPLELGGGDVFMSLVPMFHVHSWGVPYLAVLSGAKYVLAGRYEPSTILRLIGEEGVTFSTMVPSILYMLLSSPDLGRYAGALRGWKVIIGGAALPAGLAKRAEELGVTIIGGYGLSETAPVLTIAAFNDALMALPRERRAYHYTSAGLPLPMVDLRVVDGSMRPLPRGEGNVGEVVARAPWLTSGYFQDDERTAELWRGGWLHTGDLGFIDELGYLHIVDREKDAVKSGGEFIPTLVVENAISEHPAVGEVAVVGVPDEKWGERPVAFIVAKGEVTEGEILDHLGKYVATGRIQKWWIPDRVVIVGSLPKTSTGKVDKKALRASLTGGSG